MIEYYLICDESGRLGYSDKIENSPGEFSVVAGALIPSNHFIMFTDHLNVMLNGYSLSNDEGEKFHITDLKTEAEQAQLRIEIFALLRKFNISIVYGARYLKPLSDEYNQQKELTENSFNELKKHGVSIDKNLNKFKKLIQAECFLDMYTKAICTLIAHFNSTVNLKVITDEVDNKTLEILQDKINFRHFKNENNSLNSKRFHQESKEIEKFGVSVKASSNDPREELLRLSNGSVTKQAVVHSIVADVIANSIYHYIGKYIQKEGYGPLNSFMSIKEHPLAESFVGMSSTAIDKIYAYKAV